MTNLPVVPIDPGAAPDVVSVLSDAFTGYPVMRFVLGDRADASRLRTLVNLFVMARVHRGEPMLGISRDRRLVAAAIVSFPDGRRAPPEFQRLRAEVWKELGADAEMRYEAYGAATLGFEIGLPHVHLNMIGVRQDERGRGHARRLIEAVEQISDLRPESHGVTLTTEDPANVAFYERLGFEIVGHAQVADGLETWGFWKRKGQETDAGGGR